MSQSAFPDDGIVIGTDIGGTFTDLVVLDGVTHPRTYKSATTPENRAVGIVDALALAAADSGQSVEDFARRITYFAHGTTAATNALIERKGATTALLTTKGFRDTIVMQRATSSWVGHGNTGHYSHRTNPTPLIPRDLIVELPERIDSHGRVLAALDRQVVESELKALRERGVTAIAVSLLWSFVNPAHERLIGEVAAEVWPEVYLTLSHEIAPVLGEYERSATTLINSYLGPVIKDYMGNLAERLRAVGCSGELSILDSGGGVMRPEDAARRSVAMMTSGPAGGVLTSATLARELGYPNVITSDMGGTSFDVGLVVGGEPVLENTSEAGGYHLVQPRIKVTAIGAGGGSIARIDDAGALVVGPESAGAVPGPACYGRGGDRPTVTDADVVLGIIDPSYFLGGTMSLRRDLADEAIRVHIAEPLGLSVHAAAAGIREVADNQMADLLRKVTVQQGFDPRDFVVFAYGGAGPTHAYAYTAAAGIGTLVVPSTSAVHSAYGVVTADRFRTVTLTDVHRIPAGTPDPATAVDVEHLGASFAALVRTCAADLDDDPRATFRRVVHVRFRRQTHEIPIELPDGPITTDVIRQVLSDFLETYERLYGEGTAVRSAGIELLTLRVEGRIPADRGAVSGDVPGAVPPAAARVADRTVTFPETGEITTSVYRGDLLAVGSEIEGPAILEFQGTTVVLGPSQSLVVDNHRNLVINTGVQR